MATESVENLVRQIEACRGHFDARSGRRACNLLRRLDRIRFRDTTSLIRFHELLLFLRAFPHNRAVLRLTERLLQDFYKKVQELARGGVDMDMFDPTEVSGIAGTVMEDTVSFDVALWLVDRLPGKVQIAWDNYEPGRELGTTGPRLLPLLADDADVEADTPFRRWLETAGRNRTATWLIGCFDRMEIPARHKAELYESLRIPLRWELGNAKLSRTRNWRPARKAFFHTESLISRSHVSLTAELARRPPQFRRMSRRQSETIIDLIREVMLVRYRELYGTTLGDPRSVVQADVGRGVSIFLWNLPPERRLPLRAYVAGLTLKNGVPINYIEAIGLCEWIEVGFNTFYTFRGGEAAWIYAQVLRCLCARMGSRVISVYPYQLGHDNDEAIESGAFWFYRKLGFRPGKPELRKLVALEEARIAAADPSRPYRTPARTLKRLAAGHVFYELPGADIGAWDRFSTRTIGLRAARTMSQRYGGDVTRMTAASRQRLERFLGVKTSPWADPHKAALDNYALALSEVDLRRWNAEERRQLLRLIRAKAAPDEMEYLGHTQKHARLRQSLLRLGSAGTRS